MLPDFPDFTPLSLDHKDMYDQLVADYPPFADITFSNLHTWWNLDGKLAASQLNSNLVLNYNLPFDPEHSGYGLIGVHRVDDSLKAIFAQLAAEGRPARVVNVPEFTIEKIADKSAFSITEEADFNEYVMSSDQLAKLEGADHSRTRRKVNRFLRETENVDLEIKSLDLEDAQVCQQIISSIKAWHEKYPSANDPNRLEEQALERTLTHAPKLGTLNLCVFINGELHGVSLFHPTPDGKHYIINHLRVDYHWPNIFDYLTQQVAQRALDNDVPFLNMEMDLGLEGLRQHKMGLRPVKFYRKFTVEPRS